MKFQLTDLGKNLLSSLQAGERLIFTKAEASAEYSSSPQSLLSVQNKVQDIQIEGVQIDQESKRAKLKMTLTNIGLNSEYDLKQLGVYAKAAAGEEILYLVGQDSRGERIPAITDKEVEFDYSIWFNYDDAYEIIVSISGNDFLKKQEFITAVEDFESRKLDTDGGDISKTITTITEPTGTEAYPDILAAGGITETVIGKLVRWLKSLKADKVDVTDYENHTHDDRYYTENEVNTELDKKVTASGGNIADTKVGSITASTTSYPVPTAGDTVKVGFGKIIKFFGDVKNWMTGVCLIGSIVNNCVTNNAKLPLSAAQGKVLMDLYTVLNTKLNGISMRSFNQTPHLSVESDRFKIILPSDIKNAQVRCILACNRNLITDEAYVISCKQISDGSWQAIGNKADKWFISIQFIAFFIP